MKKRRRAYKTLRKAKTMEFLGSHPCKKTYAKLVTVYSLVPLYKDNVGVCVCVCVRVHAQDRGETE